MRNGFAAAIAVLTLAIGTDAWAGPADDQYAVAAGQYARGRYPLAVQEFELFLERYPQHSNAPLAQFFTGKALVQLGRYADARVYFDRFHAAHPDHRMAPQALFRRGEAAYLTGDRDAARKHLSAFHQQHPNHALNNYALPYLADLLLAPETAAQSAKLYEEALARIGDSPQAEQCRFGLGRALQLSGDFAEAAGCYQTILAQPNSPLADDALVQLAQLHCQRGEYPAAVAVLDQLALKHPATDLAPFADYWRGVAEAGKEDWAAAAAAFNRAAAVETNPQLSAAANFHLAEVLRKGGDEEAALQQYEKLIQQTPDSSWADDAARTRVQLAFDARDYNRAEALATEFLEAYPASPLRFDVRRTLGRSHLKRNQHAQAVAVLSPLAGQLGRMLSTTTLQTPELPKADAEKLLASTRYLLALAHLAGGADELALGQLSGLDVSTADAEFAAAVHAASASALMGLKRYEEAVAPLSRYLELQPAGPDAGKASAQLAVALTETGRWEEAEQAFSRYAAQHRTHDQFLPTTLYLAEAAYQAERREWARRLFAVLAEEGNPEQFRARGLSGKAWAELETADAAAGASTFEELIKNHPDSPLVPEAALARAKTLEELKQPEAAIATYRIVIDKHPNSKQTPTALHLAAKLLDETQQDQAAAALLQRLVDDYPKQPDLDAALYRLAWVKMDLGRQEEAASVLGRLLAEHPGSRYWGDAAYRLAQTAATVGDFAEVEQLTQRIIAAHDEGAAKIEPQVLAHALYLQGQTAARAGRWDKVSAPMQRLLDEFPRSELRVSAQYWLAESHYRQDRFKEAAEQFALLSRNTQGRNETWLAMIPLRRAQILAQDKQWAAALALADKVVTQYPGFSQQYEVDFLIGRCLASQAKFQEARQAYVRAATSPEGRRTETAAKAEWMIGESYFHQKDYANAIRAYSRVELLYDFPRWQAAALLQTGKCYEMQQLWASAIESYQQLLAEFPQTIFADEAKQRLQVAQQKSQNLNPPAETVTGARRPTASPR